MEHGLDGVTLAIGIIVTFIFLGLLFFLLRMSSGFVSSTNKTVIDTYADLTESNYARFVGSSIEGSEVQYAVEHFSDLTVKVKTSNSSGFFTASDVRNHSLESTAGITGMKYTAMYDSDSNYYVPGDGTFAGNIVRDANDNIIGLTFQQQDNGTVSSDIAWVSNSKGTPVFSELSDGVYDGSALIGFLQTTMHSLYSTNGIHFSVSVLCNGSTVFMNENSTYQTGLISPSDEYSVTVVKGTNKNVFIEIRETTPDATQEFLDLLHGYNVTVGGTHYGVLLYGENVKTILLDYVNSNSINFSVTNSEGQATYNKDNPYSVNSLSYTGIVDPTGVFCVTVTESDGTVSASAVNTEIYSGGFISGEKIKQIYNATVIKDSSNVVKNVTVMINETIANVNAIDSTKQYKLSSIDYSSGTGYVSKLYFTN